MDFGITGIAAITVICYLAAQLIKATPLDNKWLPVICGILGGGLGVLGMYIMPDFPAEDIITAIAVGIVSGLGRRERIRYTSSFPGTSPVPTTVRRAYNDYNRMPSHAEPVLYCISGV